MDPHTIVAALGIYIGTFVVGAISSLVPFVSIDLFLIGVTLAAGAGVALPVVLLSAAGQVAGKLPIYYAMRGVTSIPGPHRPRVDRVKRWIQRWHKAPHLVLGTSAVLGLPPFSIVATAAGALGIRVRPFCVVVFAGRALRFALVVTATIAAAS